MLVKRSPPRQVCTDQIPCYPRSNLLKYRTIVAEEMRTPLYMVSAGELGISSNDVEKELTKVLDLAYRWNAVLLLDESDVFLEQRDSQNLQRNQLVSSKSSNFQAQSCACIDQDLSQSSSEC